MDYLRGRDWPYWAGGVAIALANVLLLAAAGRPWSITSMLTYAGSRTIAHLGLTPREWGYFQDPARGEALAAFGWWDPTLWLNLGIVAGAFLAAWWAGEWRLRRVTRGRTVALALGGGLLMGYGARLALGCNAGALLGGIPSLSLHGWLFLLFTFLGVAAGLRLFRRLL
ncbi:MAG: YeeE/YedE thiosulfate transporter family protein [Bacillota bacterium]